MKIKIKKYEYNILNGKVKRTEIKRNWFCQLLINIILFLFKIINFRHTYSKDEYGRRYVQEILDIRGLRTCAYMGIGGQVYISQFLFKFGKYYI
jgi:hypothetical protein